MPFISPFPVPITIFLLFSFFLVDAVPLKVVDIINNPIGIYGWRKYCLYISVLLLTCLAIINIGLAVFIMKVLDINSQGAGVAQFDSNVFRVEGAAEVIDGLYTNQVNSFQENSLSLLSTNQIVLQSNSSSTMTLSNGLLSVQTPELQAVYNGQPYLSASGDLVTISSAQTTVTSSAGMVVDGSVQTSRVQNMHANGLGLTVESIAQQLTLQSAQNLTLSSTAGALSMSALTGITLTSPAGITLSSTALTFSNIPTYGSAGQPYALCVCQSGKVYRVSSLNATLTCATFSTIACP